MNEEELKATVGEAAFNAMSAEQRTALLEKFSKLEPKNDPPPKPKDEGRKEKNEDEKNQKDDGLFDRARREKEAEADKKLESKRLESALRFIMTSKDWFKEHADLLPSDIEDIFKTAERENYDTALEKANALRAAIVQSFFSVQSNVDLLTPSQKASVDEYLKLTKNGREQKAEFAYENFFEPTLELLKRLKKAEEVGRARSGFKTSSKVEDQYKERLMAGSRRTYLGEKASNG